MFLENLNFSQLACLTILLSTFGWPLVCMLTTRDKWGTRWLLMRSQAAKSLQYSHALHHAEQGDNGGCM